MDMRSSSPVLVTGAAGYIGGHIVYDLLDHGYPVVVLDNLSRSRADLLPGNVPFFQIDVRDTDAVSQMIRNHKIDTVIHMAAFLSVEESMADPLMYYHNNVEGTRSLLRACLDTGIKKLIFSSTGATYRSSENPLRETDPQEPGSPYGSSKLMAEKVIRDVAATSDLHAVILRYFNVVGADPQGRTGQQGTTAPHLISRACQAAAGDLPQMTLYGTDYPTIDGTCVRDYIHVSDLASAHRIVMEQDFTDKWQAFNCGYGVGFSVRQVIDRVKAVTGIDFPVIEKPRRPGDLAQTVANNHALLTGTPWRPQLNDLDRIIETAWNWYQRERLVSK